MKNEESASGISPELTELDALLEEVIGRIEVANEVVQKIVPAKLDRMNPIWVEKAERDQGVASPLLRRKKETLDACSNIHGGTSEEKEATLDEFVKSVDIGNLKDVKTELCHDLEEDDKVSGSYRDLESFLIELAKMYVHIDQVLKKESFFMHYGSEPYHFRVAIGADGAPFGKDDEATAWLLSFLNVGEMIASEAENYLIAGANCSESHIAMIRYAKMLTQDIAHIESQIYVLPDDQRVKFTIELLPSDMKWASTFSGELPNSAYYFPPFGSVNADNKNTVNWSLGEDDNRTWRPGKYQKRLEMATKVQEKKKKN
ncbi:uncharacterized protein LOC116300771 [Actinia tenebrosa]|uniref:Uncharacterized protein LOC116300771 n=1 Tax=Actinia tenebrosa TaxID=6105 RepID=A0A6P8IFQ2_ACTTE|nr:uncharacterized protein LOC116300771 [Actinia tenebrosa]